jgi:riboflavin synthase
MFTGLIQEVGKVRSIKNIGDGIHVDISAPKCATELHIHDSVAINGVCLTVTRRTNRYFSVLAVEETLRKTTLAELHTSALVNLELAVRVNDRLGGHLVQGHVDCVGTVTELVEQTNSRLVTVSFPVEFSRYVIPVGSIAVDGVSLTIASLELHAFTVSLIPHTLENTTFAVLRPGTHVNLEFDLVGKYVERLISSDKTERTESQISVEKLKSWGYDL